MRFFEKIFGEQGRGAERPREELRKPPAEESKREEKLEKRANPLITPEEAILEKREKTSSKDIKEGISKPIFVQFQDDGAGIFKSSAREKEWEYIGNYKKERAAYLVDRFLGFGLVPPTVLREVDGEMGSVQEFIPDAKTAAEAYLETPFTAEEIQALTGQEQKQKLTKEQKQSLKTQLFQLWLFDYLIYNRDRHGGNLLVKENKIYAIDHGFTFKKNDFYYPFCRFFDTPIPKEVKDAFERFYSWKEGKEILRDLLSELLSKDEVDCFFKRVEVVAEFTRQGMIPGEALAALKFNPEINN